MKKLLALVLALVMTMSLVTISNAAFKDADKIDYDEAVTVMNAVGVLVGDENGNFNAKENLTRAQAAKIISYLLLGNKTAEALAGSGKFTDVAKTSWSAGFVDYCASTGVVNGVGNGKFDPNGQLTGYQFAKMLLVALGYDATIEGFTGADWQINVSKRADQADLFDGLDISGNAALTREQAAQMCLNTLKSPLVEYSNKGGSLTVNGATVNIGASNAEYKTSSTKLADQTIYDNKLNSSAGEYIVEFAEQYYPKLVLDTDFDDFGRPCYTWSYDKKDLGTFAMKDMLEKTFVGEVTGKDLYDVLGKSVVEDYKVFVAIDGVEDEAVNSNVFNKTAINKNNKKAIGDTGTGVVTEVYVNNDAKEVYIVIVNEYLAIAAKDYDSKKETVDFTVYGVDLKAKEYVKTNSDDKNTGKRVNDYETVKGVSSDDFALVADAKEDDAYVVTLAAGVVQSVVKADVVEDVTLTSFKQGDNVKADGTTYKYASAAEYNYEVLDQYTSTGKTNLKEKTYNIYLDTRGNLLGIDIVKGEDNYVFIAGVDTAYSNLSAKNYDASAIFTDGTMKTIKFKADKSNIDLKNDYRDATVNKWCTYTVDKDGIYTLKVVTDGAMTGKVKVAQEPTASFNTAIDKKHISLPGNSDYTRVYGNDDSVYLLAELKAIKIGTNYAAAISGVDSVTTGIKDASLTGWNENTAKDKTITQAMKDAKATFDIASSGVYALYKSNGYIIAAVVVGEDNAASKNLVYVNSGSVSMEAYDSAKDEWTWTREVIIDGEKAELTEVGDDLTYLDAMGQGKWYQVKYNAKGNVVGVVNDTTNTTWSLTKATGTTKDKAGDYVETIEYLENAINNSGKDTVLYNQKFGKDAATANATAPTMKGSTLYVDATATKGFYVDENAKVVFIQSNDGKSTTEYETGAKEVQSFIESLNKKENAGYFFTISAILKNGAAQVVIINDGIDATYKGNKTDVDTSAIKGITLSETDTKVRYYGTQPSPDATLAAIEAKILAGGNTITEKAKNGTVYTWKVTDSHGFAGAYKFNTSSGYTQLFKVTFTYNDGTAVTPAVEYMAAGDSVTLTISNKDGSAFSGSYTGATIGGSAGTDFQMAADHKSATVKWTATGLSADANLTVSFT